MLQGKQSVQDYLTKQPPGKYPFWKIHKGAELIMLNWDDGHQDTGQSYDYLGECLDILGPGNYTLVLAKETGSKGAGSQLRAAFTLAGTGAVNAQGNLQTPQLFLQQSQVQAEKIAKDLFEKWKLEEEVRKMRQELTDLRTGKINGMGDTPFERVAARFLGAIEPYAPQILHKIGAIDTPGAPAQNHHPAPQPASTQEAEERLGKALESLSHGLGPNDTIAALESLASRDPDELKKLLPMVGAIPAKR